MVLITNVTFDLSFFIYDLTFSFSLNDQKMSAYNNLLI